jgi:hypothetical protein
VLRNIIKAQELVNRMLSIQGESPRIEALYADDEPPRHCPDFREITFESFSSSKTMNPLRVIGVNL